MNKERIIRILYIISVVLVIVCTLAATASFFNSGTTEDVIWHGMKFPVNPSMNYEKSDTSINFTGIYDSQSINITITNDTTDFKNTVPTFNDEGVYMLDAPTEFNSTHSIVTSNSDGKYYLFLVPSDNVNDENILSGNPTIIECVGTNGDYMFSFILNTKGGY